MLRYILFSPVGFFLSRVPAVLRYDTRVDRVQSSYRMSAADQRGASTALQA
jgi:hypothetical protein